MTMYVWEAGCDVPRLDVLSTASLCPANFVVDLCYLLTVVMNSLCWFIFRFLGIDFARRFRFGMCV